MRLKTALLTLLLPLVIAAQDRRVRTGAEILLEKNLELLQGLRVGVLCNHTAILPNRTHLIDTLRARGVRVVSLFSAEHGIRGMSPAGARISDTMDRQTGLPVYSLYSVSRETAASRFKDIDVLVIDIQDVGARFYTYFTTVSHALEAAADIRIRCIVLDRPNPINGIDAEGPVLDTSLGSTVGRFPLPVRHGLTIGELTRMAVGEGWITESLALAVLPMEGWHRTMWFDETRLPWVPPSPNMRSLPTAIVYPGTCLFEGTNVSEGRGSFKPFEYLGAPWINGKELAARMNAAGLPGVRFHPIQFTPRGDSIRSPHPKYEGELCRGVFLQVKDRATFRPVLSALATLSELHRLYPTLLRIHAGSFDRLAGSREIRKAIESGLPVDSLYRGWNSSLETFRATSSKYLLY